MTPCRSPYRSPWWAWLPTGLLLLLVLITWDDGATSLFLGAVVPLHVATADNLLRWCPTHRLAFGALLARASLLVPVLVAGA